VRQFAIIILALLISLSLGCNEKRNEEIAALQSEIEALKKESKELKEELARLEEFMKAQKKFWDAQTKFKEDRDKALKLRDINITLARIRDIAVSLEMYRVENSKYPNNLTKLKEDYLSSIPLVDSWKNEILYIFDETNQQYQLISKGADREIDTDDDIIYAQGSFLKTGSP